MAARNNANNKGLNQMSNFDPKKVKVVKAVTRETLTLVEGEPVYIKALKPMYVGKEIKGTEAKADSKPADILDVINLETGKEQQLVIGAVVKSNFEEAYEKNAYVGKSFMITKLGKKEGKRYFNYEISEIEV